jgi:hypothetical protein
MQIASILAVLGIAVMFGTEILRSVVHRRREQRDGLGGTQDIAMWGTFIGLACFVGAGVCAVIAKLKH